MTTPDGLTAALETLLSVGLHELLDPDCDDSGPPYDAVVAKARELARSPLAASIARHVRETGCDGLRGRIEGTARWRHTDPDQEPCWCASPRTERRPLHGVVCRRLRAALASPEAPASGEDR